MTMSYWVKFYSAFFQFKPWKPRHPTTTIGRQYYLSVSIGTNNSDWTSGWKSYMDGFTVFYRFVVTEFEITFFQALHTNKHLMPVTV